MIRSMMSFVLVMGVSSFAFANTGADRLDKSYFQIKKVTVTEVANSAADLMTDQQVAMTDACNSPARPFLISRTGDPKVESLSPLGELQVWVDQILNIGKKIWAVVEAGKPVVTVRMDSANALPRGIQCWTDMSGWSAPQAKTYQVRYENAYGINVIDFTYRVMFTAGGNVDGVGKYIANATVIPANINVAWGFKLDANTQIASVFNQGTRQDPLAAMQMNVQWRVDSPLTHDETTETFLLTGSNSLVKMQ